MLIVIIILSNIYNMVNIRSILWLLIFHASFGLTFAGEELSYLLSAGKLDARISDTRLVISKIEENRKEELQVSKTKKDSVYIGADRITAERDTYRQKIKRTVASQ